MKGKILVIEDHPKWQTKLREALEQSGFDVDIANNFENAIEKIKKESFVFITVDMNLDQEKSIANEFEGWDILKTIKKLRSQKNTPVMVITGYGTEYKVLSKEKQIGSLFFMEKGSFDKHKLISIINDLIK